MNNVVSYLSWVSEDVLYVLMFILCLVELLFDHFERRRENKAAQWMEKAYEFRHKLVLPIFIEQVSLQNKLHLQLGIKKTLL